LTIESDLLKLATENSVLQSDKKSKIDLYLSPETSPGIGGFSERGFNNSLLINNIKVFFPNIRNLFSLAEFPAIMFIEKTKKNHQQRVFLTDKAFGWMSIILQFKLSRINNRKFTTKQCWFQV
jgi:hypothetical protein